MEDFVTWVDTSKLKRTIMSYNDEVRLLSFFLSALYLTRDVSSFLQLDDFDLL